MLAGTLFFGSIPTLSVSAGNYTRVSVHDPSIVRLEEGGYKQYFSVRCMDDVITARMNKAKSLLKHTDLRIQEIAIQCGYQNVSHFMRQFKEKCGMTAMQYRKSNK